MNYINYVVSDLRPVENVSRSFFQSQHCAYKYGFKSDSKNVANFIDLNKEKIQKLWSQSEIKFKNYQTILAKRLNNLHGTNYSNEFWKRVFSTSLLNHITLLHQFYTYSSQNFDPSVHTCKILSEKSYHFVNDFMQQRQFLTSSNLGQEQMFSLYIKCFYPNIYSEFNFYKKNINDIDVRNIENSIFRKYFNLNKFSFKNITEKINEIFNGFKYKKSSSVIGIMESFFENSYFHILSKKTLGKIQRISVPKLFNQESININMRDKISKIDSNMDNFDKFFFFSLKFLMPKYLIEDFSSSIKYFNNELKKYEDLKIIVSESWISSSSVNLFRALAYEKSNIKTHYNEHNCIFHPFEGDLVKIQADLVDNYLTLGWDGKNTKFLKLASLFSYKTPSTSKKYKILYVSYTAQNRKTYYSSAYSYGGAGAIKHLDFVTNFFKIVPTSILQNLYYRSYPKDYFILGMRYDKELILQQYLKHTKILPSFKTKGASCKEQMGASSLVIIDHLSTSYLEALKSNIPTICFWDPNNMYLKNEYQNYFDDLIEAKIIHTNPESAAEHLKYIYKNPLVWWNSSKTQDLKDRWLKRNFGDPKLMLDYLISLSKKK